INDNHYFIKKEAQTSIVFRQNIALQGIDVKKYKKVLSKGKRITVAEFSLLASLGYEKIKTYQMPKVSILSNGNEVVAIGQKPNNYQIRDSNYYSIFALLEKFGVKDIDYQLMKDNQQAVDKAIKKSLQADIVVISGGISMGEQDFIAPILLK